MRNQAGIVLPGYNALKVADAPTIGTATVASSTSASVTFTAPSCIGGGAISSYTAFANCGIYKTSGASSPLVVSGLTSGSSYTFKVIATNIYGPSYPSASSNSATTWTLPGAPTIGTASVSAGSLTASVPFTAPASNGGTAITTYTATSSPGGITGTLSQAGSGTVSVSGLTSGTTYTFTVTATNAVGTGPASAASNSVTPLVITGQQQYTTSGTFSWVAPAGVTSVSVVTVGPGVADTAGALSYKNNITVIPGNSYVVVVPAANNSVRASFNGNGVVSAGSASDRTGDGGGNGGTTISAGAGAGAGGYSGDGGYGKSGTSVAGTGGAGGGGSTYLSGIQAGGGGGGVGLLGEGASGAAGAGTNNTSNAGFGGGGGSGGGNGGDRSGSTGGNGGNYGATGGTGCTPGAERGGAVRIIWPGTTRSFPSTNTGNL